MIMKNEKYNYCYYMLQLHVNIVYIVFLAPTGAQEATLSFSSLSAVYQQSISSLSAVFQQSRSSLSALLSALFHLSFGAFIYIFFYFLGFSTRS